MEPFFFLRESQVARNSGDSPFWAFPTRNSVFGRFASLPPRPPPHWTKANVLFSLSSRHLWYFAVLQRLGRRAPARRTSQKPCFSQAQCLMQKPLRSSLRSAQNPRAPPPTVGVFRFKGALSRDRSWNLVFGFRRGNPFLVGGGVAWGHLKQTGRIHKQMIEIHYNIRSSQGNVLTKVHSRSSFRRCAWTV